MVLAGLEIALRDCISRPPTGISDRLEGSDQTNAPQHASTRLALATW